eukprot:TRINITY_DN33488_c0_g1_i2.p1 TRINITY_DN33488_c0_g1~~TRINITY_DN33488_c0_g1_i2.p1  ORF type:complete len:1401 (+),score=327.10 TRINITY_DN33488_c0_g1_i2:102-4205(+)
MPRGFDVDLAQWRTALGLQQERLGLMVQGLEVVASVAAEERDARDTLLRTRSAASDQSQRSRPHVAAPPPSLVSGRRRPAPTSPVRDKGDAAGADCRSAGAAEAGDPAADPRCDLSQRQCARCRRYFGMLLRPHWCRCCGRTICRDCSAERLSWLKLKHPRNACRQCAAPPAHPSHRRATTHVVVEGSTSLEGDASVLCIISSLASRADCLLTEICPCSGALMHDPRPGHGVFADEVAALQALRSRLVVRQEVRCAALLGYALGGGAAHLCVATAVRPTAMLPCGSRVYTVTAAQWLRVQVAYPPHKGWGPQVADLLADFPLAGRHFYCDAGVGDLLTTPYTPPNLQRQGPGGGGVGAEFRWNAALAAPFNDAALSELCPVLLQGLAKMSTLPCGLHVILLARKSSKHPGTRYTARGIDAEGAAANEVECELIMWRREGAAQPRSGAASRPSPRQGAAPRSGHGGPAGQGPAAQAEPGRGAAPAARGPSRRECLMNVLLGDHGDSSEGSESPKAAAGGCSPCPESAPPSAAETPPPEARSDQCSLLQCDEGDPDGDWVDVDAGDLPPPDAAGAALPDPGAAEAEAAAAGQPWRVRWASHLWRRGSVPLRWASSLVSPMGVGQAGIVLDPEAPQKGSDRYWAGLAAHLNAWPGLAKGEGGEIQVTLSCLLQVSPEAPEFALNEALGNLVSTMKQSLSSPRLRGARGVRVRPELSRFDWHGAAGRLGNNGATAAAWNQMDAFLSKYGFASGDAERIEGQQQGMTRVNCTDSLDRTNIFCFLMALYLAGVMRASVCGGPTAGDPTQWKGSECARSALGGALVDALAELFLSCGDVLAQLYTGTPASHADAIRAFSDRAPRAVYGDAVLGILRRYQNVMNDARRDAALRCFLGRAPPLCHPPRAVCTPPAAVARVMGHQPALHVPGQLLCGAGDAVWVTAPEDRSVRLDIALGRPAVVSAVAVRIRWGPGGCPPPGRATVSCGQLLSHTERTHDEELPRARDGTWLFLQLQRAVRCRVVSIALHAAQGAEQRGISVGALRVLGTLLMPLVSTLQPSLASATETLNVLTWPGAACVDAQPLQAGDSAEELLEGHPHAGGAGWDPGVGTARLTFALPSALASAERLVVAAGAAETGEDQQGMFEVGFSAGPTTEALSPLLQAPARLGYSAEIEPQLAPGAAEGARFLAVHVVSRGGCRPRLRALQLYGTAECSARGAAPPPVPLPPTSKVDGSLAVTGGGTCGAFPLRPAVRTARSTQRERSETGGSVVLVLAQPEMVAGLRLSPAHAGGDMQAQVRQLRVAVARGPTVEDAVAISSEQLSVPLVAPNTPLELLLKQPQQGSLVIIDVTSCYGEAAAAAELGKVSVLRVDSVQ